MPISERSHLRHLTDEESRQLFEDCHSGKKQLFSGEEPSFPLCPDRYQLIGTRYLEVSPEELLDVAKHLGDTKSPAKELIEKSYQLICEAHLVSRNIQHWNKKVDRHHLSEKIHTLVYGIQNDAPETKDTDKVPRKALLVAYEKLRGESVSEKTAAERFNRWLKDEIRLKEFLSVIGYSHHSDNHNPTLIETLYQNGWIREIYLGSGVHPIVPERTEPLSPLKRKTPKTSHITMPYWSTKDVWWPDADPEILKQRRAELFCDKEVNFRSAYRIGQELESYDTYRDLLDAARSPVEKKTSVRKDSQSGQFTSKKSQQNQETGRFKKKEK